MIAIDKVSLFLVGSQLFQADDSSLPIAISIQIGKRFGTAAHHQRPTAFSRLSAQPAKIIRQLKVLMRALNYVISWFGIINGFYQTFHLLKL